MKNTDRGAATPQLPHPWSDPVEVVQIPDTGMVRRVKASPEQCKGIAALGGLPAVASVEGELKLLPVRGGTVHVTGRVWGHVTQACVVTLDPVESEIDEDVDVVFAPPSQIRELAESADEDDGESEDERPDPPEPIEDGTIDLGKLATDALFLGLDPYPRKPDAVFEDQVEAPNPDEHPFAALKALKGDPGAQKG